MCTYFYNYRYAVCGCLLTAPDVPLQDRKVYLACQHGRLLPNACPNYTSGPDNPRMSTLIRGTCQNCQQAEAPASATASASSRTSLVARPLTYYNLHTLTQHLRPMGIGNRVVAWLDDMDSKEGMPPIPDYMEPWFRAIATGQRSGGAGTAGAPMCAPPRTTASGRTRLPLFYPNLFREIIEVRDDSGFIEGDGEVDHVE